MGYTICKNHFGAVCFVLDCGVVNLSLCSSLRKLFGKRIRQSGNMNRNLTVCNSEMTRLVLLPSTLIFNIVSSAEKKVHDNILISSGFLSMCVITMKSFVWFDHPGESSPTQTTETPGFKPFTNYEAVE